MHPALQNLEARSQFFGRSNAEFHAHSKADVKHSDMFIDVLEKYVAPGREQEVLNTAKESMDIHRAYFGGMAQAMEQTVLSFERELR